MMDLNPWVIYWCQEDTNTFLRPSDPNLLNGPGVINVNVKLLGMSAGLYIQLLEESFSNDFWNLRKEGANWTYSYKVVLLAFLHVCSADTNFLPSSSSQHRTAERLSCVWTTFIDRSRNSRTSSDGRVYEQLSSTGIKIVDRHLTVVWNSKWWWKPCAVYNSSDLLRKYTTVDSVHYLWMSRRTFQCHILTSRT